MEVFFTLIKLLVKMWYRGTSACNHFFSLLIADVSI